MINSLEESEPKFEQVGVHEEPSGPNYEQTEPLNVQENSTRNTDNKQKSLHFM
mgnify:CR=1 FL=1